MRKKNKPPVGTYIVLILVGLLLTVGTSAAYTNQINFMKTAAEANATITRIDTSTDGDGDTTYTVYVEYTVKNERFTGTYGHWERGMTKGQRVTVYYDPKNPKKINAGNDMFWTWIQSLALGAACFGFGFVKLYKHARHSAKKKELMANGKKIMAAFSTIAQDNKANYLYCAYKDEATEKVHRFVSEKLWFDPPKFREGAVFPPVPVYVDKGDTEEYYVDVEAYFSQYSGILPSD